MKKKRKKKNFSTEGAEMKEKLTKRKKRNEKENERKKERKKEEKDKEMRIWIKDGGLKR
jgi:hypothetical protein